MPALLAEPYHGAMAEPRAAVARQAAVARAGGSSRRRQPVADEYLRPMGAMPLQRTAVETSASVLALQRSAGNTAVARMLAPGGCGGGCGCGGSCGGGGGRTGADKENDDESSVVQRVVDEGAFVPQGGKVTDVGDTTGGGAGGGSAEPNEFVLWNYGIGRAELRPGHTSKLVGTIARWKSLLKAQPDVKVKIVGSASTSGSPSTASPLSVKRADALAGFLMGSGIPRDRIETGGVGTRQPLADETTSEGMARNRRVELYLIRPMTTVDTLATSSAELQSEIASVDGAFTQPAPSKDLFAYRFIRMAAQGTVEGNGSIGAQVGYVQFVREDKRIGHYLPDAGGPLFALDYSRCTKPYLPCKDVGESTARFSGEDVVDLHPGPVKAKGPVSVRDAPGTAYPRAVTKPQRGRLVKNEWSMEFVTVLGIRDGALFQPLQHFVWRVDSTRINPQGPSPGITESARIVAGGVPGAPASLDMDKAMGLQTCRFTMRRIETVEGGDISKQMCQPQLI